MRIPDWVVFDAKEEEAGDELSVVKFVTLLSIYLVTHVFVMYSIAAIISINIEIVRSLIW